MNLQNLGVQEMNAMEMVSVDGGGRLRTLMKWGRYLLDAAGVYDAIDEFQSGFSEGSSGGCCVIE